MELGLIVLDNKVVVSSRRVAMVYEKEHRDVLRAIRTIIEQVPEALRNFTQSSYTNEQGREMPEYIMDRQGFSMLVMGFTGAKAREFTYRYTQAFEHMAAQLTQPRTSLEVLQQTVNQLVEQERRLSQLEASQEHIRKTIITQPDNWRRDMNRLFNRVVECIGREKFAELRRETYKRLEERAHVDLERRLQNLKGRLALEGATKTAIDKANRMDVIEVDPKLREIYAIILKEYSIHYQEVS
jgi:Rha family phage regulatory protein